MSSLRKLLKITCFILIVAGLALIYPTVVATTGLGSPWGIMQFVFLALCAVVDLVLGARGIPAANVPSRAIKLLPAIVAGLAINAAAIGYLIYIQGMFVFVVVNGVLVLAYGAFAHLVNREYLASR